MKDCKHTKTYNTFENGEMIVHCMYCPKILNVNSKKDATKSKRAVPSVRKSVGAGRKRSKGRSTKRAD